jgi:hypothetical protein
MLYHFEIPGVLPLKEYLPTVLQSPRGGCPSFRVTPGNFGLRIS